MLGWRGGEAEMRRKMRTMVERFMWPYFIFARRKG